MSPTPKPTLQVFGYIWCFTSTALICWINFCTITTDLAHLRGLQGLAAAGPYLVTASLNFVFYIAVLAIANGLMLACLAFFSIVLATGSVYQICYGAIPYWLPAASPSLGKYLVGLFNLDPRSQQNVALLASLIGYIVYALNAVYLATTNFKEDLQVLPQHSTSTSRSCQRPKSASSLPAYSEVEETPPSYAEAINK